MDCDEAQRLLEADSDGELDLVNHLALHDHLRGCPDCVRRAEMLRARSAALHEALPRFTAPPQLAEKIRASLRAAAPPSVATDLVAAVLPQRLPSPPRRSHFLWSFLTVSGLAASFALVLAGGFFWGSARARGDFLFQEAISEHVRSLQASHLTDVASTDQHTVKPWFAGKIDFAPPVFDLAAAGFPLAGGRLDRLGGHSVAALVFHRRQHAINLFIWPIDSKDVSPRRWVRDGYNAETWTKDGFNFLAVSEIPAAEVSQFANAFRAIQP